MSTAKERQTKRRANIMADSELHQAQLKKDRWQREAQRERMSKQQLEEHRLKERLRVKDYRSKK